MACERTTRRGRFALYAAAQLYSVLFLLIALLLPSRYMRGRDFAGVAGLYVLAKILEALDRPIFELGHIVSGHTLNGRRGLLDSSNAAEAAVPGRYSTGTAAVCR